jgi:hypothetical protein
MDRFESETPNAGEPHEAIVFTRLSSSGSASVWFRPSNVPFFVCFGFLVDDYPFNPDFGTGTVSISF